MALKDAFVANPDAAMEQCLAELAELQSTPDDWMAYSLALVTTLARLGVDIDLLLRVLSRLGPVPGHEEEWRRARITALHEADRRTEQAVKVTKGLKSAGVGPPIELSTRARELLEGLRCDFMVTKKAT